MIDMNKKYRYEEGGPAVILTTTRPQPSHPVLSMDVTGAVLFHTKEGKHQFAERSLVEAGEWDDFEKGEPVMVRGRAGRWLPRYFAGVAGGGPTAYTAGGTEWTSGNKATNWPECRRPTAEELE